ncbi:MAG: preprotein translocase subunit SecA [Anaerolineae bacterium]|jgi:preprotein translocase subunit SecA|nr:preprotein translocase subunit SecA [Chloroflexota bacterium]
MLAKLARAIFGDPNEREIKKLRPIVQQIADLEPAMQARSDADLAELTQRHRARVAEATRATRERLEASQAALEVETDDDLRRDLRIEIEALEKRLSSLEKDVLDAILPEAFAAVREASVRAIGLRHFDEQMLGGIVLHRNMIAEMKTGEGKTLVATLPLYLGALTGRGVHLVTPNDYLSKVGAQWMGPVYHLLGLSVGVIQSMGEDPSLGSFLYDPSYPASDDRYLNLRPCPRADAYRADITYGTNNEFGFDYLRDNMAVEPGRRVQRELNYAIVDEVDNILIDEARTPLIISAPAEESTDQYRRFAQIVTRLSEGPDYTIDEKRTNVTITDDGINKVERALGIDNLYSPDNYELTPYLENALKARALFQRDRDYVVTDGNVIIVDEFTGRLMHGRRYSEGLHQAIEAKENVRVQRESLTMATITFQNYFRMYRRLAGMTGTAETEAQEFAQIYDLEVLAIPTHEPMIRVDHPDVIYKTPEVKFRKVVDEIRACHEQGQPVLVGTLAIETSEMLSHMLERQRIPHQVLNAKYHEQEALIIAQAGQPAAVTIATNMAGRGVDILLGGNPEGLAREALRKKGLDLQALEPGVWDEALAQARAQVARDREQVRAVGGLHVIGTERYEARRIDNQLRGRSGRQGDPGSSRFFVSLQDDLMQRFGGPSVARIMDQLGVDEDLPLEHAMVNRAIEGAQERVEGHNFDMRKHLLEYDDVLNHQRQVIYEQRRLVLSQSDLREFVLGIVEDELRRLVRAATDDANDEWDLGALHDTVRRMIGLPASHSVATWRGMSGAQIEDQVLEIARSRYAEREAELGVDTVRQMERLLLLRVIDMRWIRHLTALDELRNGIGLRAIGQRNPLVEYKREAFQAFEELMTQIQSDVAQNLFNIQLTQRSEAAARPRLSYSGSSAAGSDKPSPRRRRPAEAVGRNDPCPCGSGKKYKHCCLPKGLSPEEAAAQAAGVASSGRGRSGR